MASKVLNIVEITSLKYGDVLATGLMQTSLTQITGIKEGTASLNIGEPSTTPIKIEESQVDFGTIPGSRDADLTVEMIGATNQAIAPLVGATYSAADASNPEMSAYPANLAIVLKAIEIAGKNSNGDIIKFQIPKANVIGFFNGNIGRGQARGWSLKCKILIPLDANGVAQNWLYIATGVPTS